MHFMHLFGEMKRLTLSLSVSVSDLLTENLLIVLKNTSSVHMDL